jgi:hypothetical protein
MKFKLDLLSKTFISNFLKKVNKLFNLIFLISLFFPTEIYDESTANPINNSYGLRQQVHRKNSGSNLMYSRGTSGNSLNQTTISNSTSSKKRTFVKRILNKIYGLLSFF